MAQEPVQEEYEPASDQPVMLHDRALDNLSFIRNAMERTEPFTGVSGAGMIGMGVIALIGGAVARLHLSYNWWIDSWILVAVIGCLTGLAAMAWKVQHMDRPSVRRTSFRFGLHVAPAIFCGAVLTIVCCMLNLDALLPGIWLLLYGTGVIGGGAFSVRIVPLAGMLFLLLGAGSLGWTLWFVEDLSIADRLGEIALAAGFGGLHIIFGSIIAWKYGG